MHSAAVGFHAPAASIPYGLRGRVYVPPCTPSSSGRGLGSRLVARAGKGGKDDKGKREEEKADFSAKWALRVKNFFSSRRKYLQQAEQTGDSTSEKAFQAGIEMEEKKLRELKDQVVALRMEKLLQEEEEGDPRPNLIASDIAKARLDLQTSPLTRAAMAVVRMRELLRALMMLPFTAAAAAQHSWQGMFSAQRYENFLMSEGERIWYWRNRSENERWFWEVFVWDRLLFPIIAIVCWEFLVPNHFLWAVVAPLGLLAWLSGRLATPATPEFWLLAYFGFYRKVWPDVSAWLAANAWAVLGV